MNRTLVFFLITLSYNNLAWSEYKLSLEDIKKFALANNFGAKATEAEVQEIKAQTSQKRSETLPQLSLVTGPGLRSQDNKTESNTVGYVEGRWNIYRGSQDRIDFEVSELNEKIAETKNGKVQFELELDVEGLFYKYLYKDIQIMNLQHSLELTQKHKQFIKMRKISGMASEADIMEFELRESFLKSELSSLVQEKEEVKLGLLRLMGPNLDTQFEPFGDIPHTHLEKSLTQFLAQINSTSSNLKVDALAVAKGALELKKARYTWFPRIDLEMKYGKLSQEIAQSYPAVEGSLLLKWEFFSGMKTAGFIAENMAKSSRLNFEFQQKLLHTMTEAEINYTKLSSIQERIHGEDGNELRAQKYYTSVLSDYRRGVKNGADLKVAEELLLMAKNRRAELRFQFIDTKIRLEKALGLFIETTVHR